MSNKPLKRGDQKAIAAKMARKQRKDESISPLPPRTMIFCEGTKTEPHYLREIVCLINERHRGYVRENHIQLDKVVNIVGVQPVCLTAAIISSI